MGSAKQPYFTTVLEAIDTFDRAANMAELSSALFEASKFFGYDNAAYFSAPTADRHIFRERFILSNWPKGWVDEYVANKWTSVDLVATALHSRHDAFRWSAVTIPDGNKIARRIINVAAADYGLKHGICVPVYNNYGYESGFSFCGSEVNLDSEVLGAMNLISVYAVSRFSRLRSVERKRKLLSPREREVLSWAAAGKSSWEIGEILSIAEDTVDKTIRAAMLKLNTFTRAQAVAESIRSGEISL